MGRSALEVSPVGQDLGIQKCVLELRTVALRVRQVEERRIRVQLVPRAHNCNIRLPVPLEGQHKRKVRLIDPHALVGETLGLEATELQGNVGRVFEHLVTACRGASDVLEYLAHQAIPTAWICRINDLHLFLGIPCRISGLVTEEELLLTLVSIKVF